MNGANRSYRLLTQLRWSHRVTEDCRSQGKSDALVAPPLCACKYNAHELERATYGGGYCDHRGQFHGKTATPKL